MTRLEHLKQIRGSAERLEGLVREILDTSLATTLTDEDWDDIRLCVRMRIAARSPKQQR